MGGILCPDKKNKNRKDEEANDLNKFEQAIFKAKMARDNVKSYIKRMGENSLKQKSLAKERLKSGDKDKAKFFLSKSKIYETQIEVGNGQLTLLEQQIIQIDQAKNELSAIKALEEGNKLLKELQSAISIDKWENIAEDMNEAREQQREINEFFSSHNNQDYEVEIENELEKMMGKVDFPEIKKDKIELKVEEDLEKEQKEHLLS